MAAVIEAAVFEKKKKRKRKENEKKLHIGSRVEVRSVEDGFKGSWHLGTVIASKDCIHHVRYDHLLCDNGDGPLIESVAVRSMYETKNHSDDTPSNYRGKIRPPPPRLDMGEGSLHYGLCVDCFYNDAWWEGVVFDHEDSLEVRTIFFPDLGDEMEVEIETLRITQDWAEALNNWKPRGTWLFLELIEEYAQEWPLMVSVKQIWYDMRVTTNFWKKISEWTFWLRTLWEDFVLQAIQDHFYLTVKEVFCVMDLENHMELDEWLHKKRKITFTIPGFYKGKVVSGGLAKEADRVVVLSEPPLAAISNPHALVTVESMISLNDDSLMNKDAWIGPSYYLSDRNDATAENLGDRGNRTLSDPNPHSCSPVITNGKIQLKNTLEREDETQKGVSVRNGSSGQGRRNNRLCTSWLPVGVGTDLLPRAEFCPDAISKYALIWKEIQRFPDIVLKARMHLAYLGWKIMFGNSDHKTRMRYISPDGKSYYSLVEVCHVLRERINELPTHTSPSEKEMTAVAQDSNIVVGESEYCPQAVIDWYEHASMDKKKERNRSGAIKSKDLILKAKKHLLAVGWTIQSAKRKGKYVLRYASSKGKCYFSLQTACKACMEEGGISDNIATTHGLMERRNVTEESNIPLIIKKLSSGMVCTKFKKNVVPKETKSGKGSREPTQMLMESINFSEESSGSLTGKTLSSAIVCTELERSVVPLNTEPEKGATDSSSFSQSRELVEHRNLQAQGFRKPRKRRKNGSLHVASPSLQTRINNHLQTRENMLAVATVRNRNLRYPLNRKINSPTVKKRHESRALIKLRDKLASYYQAHVLRSSKRARHVVLPTPSHHNPRTVLSWLIDNNAVLPRAKVHYIRRKGRSPMAEGRITRDGIKCSCCRNVFTLTGFEVHAGSNNHRAAASIFLEDGRSLLDCQMQMVQNKNLKSFKSEPHLRIKGNQCCRSDYICSVCHYGGELLLCDQCPSSFHISCVGLKDVPKGKWFCPSCRCGICGRSEFNGNNEQFTAKTVLYCDQCEREYHVGCLRKSGLLNLESYPKGNFFCSKRCEKIFFDLRTLLGKPIPVGDGDLSWTILRSIKDDSCDVNTFSIEAIAEHHSKLNLALGVLHECFEPVKERRTKRDLIEDVIFSRGSELSRLNFRGFYTVLLERKDELISVATMRVFGEKVAEVPLLGTRVQYRRLGMCRILMNELEKKLVELGVERLILPAVSQVLPTWTNSFGFLKMSNFDRLKFLKYTFLDFQETIMCQKLLIKTPAAESDDTREFQDEFKEIDDNVDSDRHSIISEVIQAEEIESEIAEQIPLGVAVGNDNNGCASMEAAPPVVLTIHAANLKSNQCENDIGSEHLVGKTDDSEGGGGHANRFIKFYVRRKIAVATS